MKEDCQHCFGKGYVQEPIDNDGSLDLMISVCDVCHGTGIVDEDKIEEQQIL